MMSCRWIVLLLLLLFPATDRAADKPARFSPSRRTWLRVCAGALILPFGGLAVEKLTTESDHRQNAAFAKAARDERIDYVVIGDSLSSSGQGATTGAIGSVLKVYRDRNVRTGGWAMGAPTSLYERLASDHAIRVTNLARSGAYIDGEALEINRTVANQSRDIYNLSDQVAILLNQRRFPVGEFPNHITIWIGHNNMDWVWDRSEMINRQDRDWYFKMIPRRVCAALEEKILDIIGRATLEAGPTQIVVQGLFDFRNAYAARREVAEIRKQDPSRFPAFPDVPGAFPSISPEYEAPTVKLVDDTNAEFKAMIAALNQKLSLAGSKITLTYRDNFRALPLNTARYLHEADGFHFSAAAHTEVAEQAIQGL